MVTDTITATFTEEMGEALLKRDDLSLRLLVQAWLRSHPNATKLPRPRTRDHRVLSAAAALAELLALQLDQAPPVWTKSVGGLPQPFFVMELAERPGFTRDLCLTEAPEPFRKRNIFAPGNFLNMV